ncbi:MAG: pyruvate carboxyltransferase [Salinivirgaceae bacterium]|nr:MAG: pyruvate carboxyltransferase [Salinivirgaceae bacterium]
MFNYPKKVNIADITIRDGFQHEERIIPLDAKVWMAEQLVLAGFKHLEIGTYGNSKIVPQFNDIDELFKRVRNSKRIKDKLDDVVLTVIAMREKPIERAIEAYKEGYGPDRILMLSATSESYQKKSSNYSIKEYWRMAEKYVKKATDAGLKVNGAVTTIWGCPIEGPTNINDAFSFARRWLDIGASDVEHADHDGSASPNRVYDYFKRVIDNFDNPIQHIAHFHSRRGFGAANVLAALQAGVVNFEATFGGTGGQPANFIDGVPIIGTGKYYISDKNITGLICLEDLVVMLDEMGIDTGLDVDKVLELGRMTEKIIGRRLRSEAIKSGRIPKKLSNKDY